MNKTLLRYALLALLVVLIPTISSAGREMQLATGSPDLTVAADGSLKVTMVAGSATVSGSVTTVPGDSSVASYFYTTPIMLGTSEAADTTVSIVQNPAASGKVLRLRSIRVSIFQDGTAVAAKYAGYKLIRYSGTAPSGGTAGDIVKRDTASATSVVTTAQSLSTGVTAGGTKGKAFDEFVCPCAVTATHAEYFHDYLARPMIFAAGEGWALDLSVAANTAQAITATFEWDEAAS